MRSPFGLRPRLLAALLATSAVTLAAAALALLPPLRDRLRDESIKAVQNATTAEVSSFDHAARAEDCGQLGNLLFGLRTQTNADVYVVNLQPAPVCGFSDPHVASDPLVGQALTNGIEGQPARVRTENGRVVTGVPAGERRMELTL